MLQIDALIKMLSQLQKNESGKRGLQTHHHTLCIKYLQNKCLMHAGREKMCRQLEWNLILWSVLLHKVLNSKSWWWIITELLLMHNPHGPCLMSSICLYNVKIWLVWSIIVFAERYLYNDGIEFARHIHDKGKEGGYLTQPRFFVGHISNVVIATNGVSMC